MPFWGYIFKKPVEKTEHKAETSLRLQALGIAISQLGQEEKPRGSNWGVPVKDYLASVGINFPASWCMAFVYWCFNKAAIGSGRQNSAYKSGGVLMVWNNSKAFRVTDPQPGDVFVIDFGKGLGHTGFVERADEKFIYTVEGNTNDSGSREGYEVCRRARPRGKIKGYLRF